MEADHPVTILNASILSYLEGYNPQESLSADRQESLQVAIQCLSHVFSAGGNRMPTVNLLQLVTASLQPAPLSSSLGVGEQERFEGERHKAEGNEYMAAKQYKEAVEAYTRAMQADPSNAVYPSNRAAALTALERYTAAVEDCHRAIALNPNYGKAHGRLGMALLQLKRWPEAMTAFERALELEPGNAGHRANLEAARLEMKKGKVEREREGETKSPLNMFNSMGPGGAMPANFANLLNNPELIRMATQMMQNGGMEQLLNNPQMAAMMQGMMGHGASDDVKEMKDADAFIAEQDD